MTTGRSVRQCSRGWALRVVAGAALALVAHRAAAQGESHPVQPGVAPDKGDKPAPRITPTGDIGGEGVGDGGDEPEAIAAPAPIAMPDLDGAIVTLLDAEYLSEGERAALRVAHGVWETSDLSTPALRQQAALIRGAFGEALLTAPDSPPLVRANALLMQGRPADVLTALDKEESLAAARLRAEALVQTGRREEAETLLLSVVSRVRDPGLNDAGEAAEGVRAMLLLARLRGAEDAKVVGYQELLSIIARARDSLDRLDPGVRVAEAMVFYEKGMYGEAAQALSECLTLCPRDAEAWHLLGRINAATFAFDDAESIALRLEVLAGADPEGLDDGQAGVSAYGCLVRAHAKLRQNEGALAEQALEPGLALWPANRDLRAMQCAAWAVSFDFEKTDQLIRAYDSLAPGAPEAWLETGKALADARQYEDAARYLRGAGERAPAWAEPHVELGLSQMQAGKLEEAKSALDKALLLDRFHARAKNSQTLLHELTSYTSIEGEHFVVRYKPGDDEAMAKEMLPQLERIYERVTGKEPGGIDHKPLGKAVVELYPNHRWFAVRIAGMPKLHTFAAATGPVIAMETPRSGPGHLVGPYDWARVVQHEYTHTVTLSRTKNRLPHWFTEAGAVYLEDAPRDWNTVQLLTRMIEGDSLFDFDTINVMFTRPRKQTDRAQAYAQGAWMYEWLIEKWGREAPLTLMDLYATGVREPEAIHKVTGLTREQFLVQFKAWARGQLANWGMVPREGQHKVAELLAGETGDATEPTPEVVEQWRQKEPGNPFVLALAARGVAEKPRSGWSAEDIKTLVDYAAARPVDPMPHRELAAYFLAGATPREAIQHLEYLDAREQNSPAYAVQLARLYSGDQKWTEAVAKARRATRISPYDGTVREAAAAIALQAGDLAEAEEQVWALTVIEPDREVHKQRLEAVRKMRK